MTAEYPRNCNLRGERLVVRLPETRDAAAIASYFTRNARHLHAFSPAPAQFADAAFWQLRIPAHRQELLDDRSCKTFIYETDDATVIGAANLSEFVRGPFQAAYLGYSLSESHQGYGFMHDALRLLIDFAFTGLRLHRIMANYMPRNTRSAAVLQRLGFTQEGLARHYLRINGVWEDHVLTALCNPSWKPQG
jgi:[ribosomal protein S5]-alanine N-acetyltransferase